MLAVLEIIFPIYALIGVGFVTTRRGVFSAEDLRAMGRYIVNLALPALMFTAIADRPLADTVQLPYFIVYGLGTLALILSLYVGYRRIGKYDHKTSTLAAMGSTCPNSGFIGYPIMLLAMPDIAGRTLAQNVIVENVLFIPLLLTMLELGNPGEGTRWQIARRITWRILTGPLVLAMLAGVTVSGIGLGLPDALNQPVHMLAASSGAVSLVVIGGTLAKLKPKGVRALAGYIVAGKLLLHPLVILGTMALVLASGLFDIPDQMRNALLLSGAMPAMGIFPVLAQAHGREGFASAAQFGGTVASLFTLTALLLLIV